MPAWLPLLCITIMLVQLRLVDLFNIAKVCTVRVKRLTLTLSIVAITIFHAAVMITVYLLAPGMEIFTVIYALLGFVLLIPMRFLFSDSIGRMLSVLCTTKGFTLMMLALSILIARFFAEEWRVAAELSALSALLVVCTPWYSHFCKAIFRISEKTLPRALGKRLLQISIIWFCATLFTYLSFTTNYHGFSLLSLIGLGALAFICYRLIFSAAKASRKNTQLTEIVYTDNLTGLENRTAFFKDGQELINKNARFEVVFLDLNRFKLVNDKYGHLKGNDYLIGFANALRALVKQKGRAYRLSGDEFVLLLKGGEGAKIASELILMPWHRYIKSIEFLGVSAGFAAYPSDAGTLDELIFIADKAMYKDKRGEAKTAVS